MRAASRMSSLRPRKAHTWDASWQARSPPRPLLIPENTIRIFDDLSDPFQKSRRNGAVGDSVIHR